MEEKNGVLIQNEKQANRAVAKVMRITFLIFTLVYLLNVFGIFVVDMGIMTLAYVAGSVLLWVPTLLVSVGKQQKSYVKYVLILHWDIMWYFCISMRLLLQVFIFQKN